MAQSTPHILHPDQEPDPAGVLRILRELHEQVCKNSEVSNSLAMLVEVRNISGQLVHDTAECEAAMARAFNFLPNILEVMVDGIEARNNAMATTLNHLTSTLGFDPTQLVGRGCVDA